MRLEEVQEGEALKAMNDRKRGILKSPELFLFETPLDFS